jgi:peptidoglycan hydrolase-like protein with peptidoglycan-binding domain
MKNAFVFFLAVFMTGPLLADEQTRVLQGRLREQGFYYGEVDGRGGEETSAAIRRYQIRHGLRVTGQANDETLRSLGISGESGTRPAPETRPQPETRPAPEYQGDRRYYDQEQNDQYYRRQPVQPYIEQEQPIPDDYQNVRPPYYRMPGVATTYPRLFAGTIYERAPAQLQENVLFAVQGELLRRGFYRGIIDGQLGPATTDAIMRFQQDQGMPITGRLDSDTLNELRALPGQRNGPREEGFRRFPGGERIYRGIPVQ